MTRIVQLLLVFIAFSGWATEKNPVETKIESVTVYREGATVTRSGQIFLKKGENSLLLKNLAPDIDENSIQISGLNNASIRSILYRIDYLEKKEPSASYNTLKLRQEQVDKAIKRINNTVAGFKEELKILGKNQIIHGDQRNISIERVKEMTLYYRDRTTAIKNELLNLEFEIDSLKLIKVDLYKEMTALQTEKNEKRGVIEIIIDAPNAAPIDLSVSYTVATAGWYPTYDVRATSTTAPVNILYKAIAVALIIEDRIPISQNKEIKVEDLEFGNGQYNEQTGIIRWEVQLAPHGTEQKNFSFTVKHPKQQRINL